MTRRSTRLIKVGKVFLGKGHPIAIQSMTNTPTEQVDATVNQIQRLSDSGCDIVRVTVQGMKEALACKNIKSQLLSKGYFLPIVADVHFRPEVALEVAKYVDKVRINPGNFARERKEDDTQSALGKIHKALEPLIAICKKREIPLRIGVNHGSLSSRIVRDYGNTLEGLVVSAMEYGEICRQLDFHDLVFSMKASETQMMVAAYRQLAAAFDLKGWDYPFHLGVTEAGFGVEGRIKSSIGIATLLQEGIGDTIRVSLTEDPVNEVYAAKKLLALTEGSFASRCSQKEIATSFVHEKCSLILPVTPESNIKESLERYDGVLHLNSSLENEGYRIHTKRGDYPVLPLSSLFSRGNGEYILMMGPEENWDAAKSSAPLCMIFQPEMDFLFSQIDNFLIWKEENFSNVPVIIYCKDPGNDEELLSYRLGVGLGPFLVDQRISGIALESAVSEKTNLHLLQILLQSSGTRIFQTEFISCPGCGRTQFDLQSVALEVKEKLKSFPGLKIAVMGCSVNGPGEMADADFGCVGTVGGKVDLYIKKECVQKNIDQEKAADELLKMVNFFRT